MKIFGKKKKVENLKEKTKTQKLSTINGLEVKVNIQDKYLRDYFHNGGLTKSVEKTFAKRYGGCLNAILELKSVIEDMHSLGGINFCSSED